MGAWGSEVVRLVSLGTREGQHWKGQVLSSLPKRTGPSWQWGRGAGGGLGSHAAWILFLSLRCPQESHHFELMVNTSRAHRDLVKAE